MDGSTTVACWKCGHVRAPDATAPAWQCPACGAAYNKSARPSDAGGTRRRRNAAPSALALRVQQVRAVVVQHRLATAVTVVAVIVTGVAAWTWSPWSERTKTAKVADAGMAAVRHALFDAESARWRDVRVVVKATPAGRMRTLCGEVNAKNRWGGYAGFQRFMATERLAPIFDRGQAEFQGLYQFFCRDERQ